jgi:hypothetical protein
MISSPPLLLSRRHSTLIPKNLSWTLVLLLKDNNQSGRFQAGNGEKYSAGLRETIRGGMVGNEVELFKPRMSKVRSVSVAKNRRRLRPHVINKKPICTPEYQT